MKKIILIILELLFAGVIHAEEDCQDIAAPMIDRWVITQKIDDHFYEIRGEKTGARAILKTKRATFTKPGYPFGIKEKYLFGQSVDLPLVNGFMAHYALYEECGIVPLPKGNIMWEAGMSVRKPLKEDK